ncbi:hypothetical protein HNQ60_000057 [Povalibacter uvarum]|uniref:Glycoside hydrolase family 20 catalytic domain-containing protein n=1 Tax=Povalibacter uvarum TaxID=732238 RepID=A0A841HDP1_9GAMM|nr:family 20 glycosylhydrolase [Povalibacter uvarum]MBB6091211.1 hypothetical protein [Povalibacter uvarum]
MPADFHYQIDPLATADAGFTLQQAEHIRRLHPLLAQLLTDAKIAKPLPALTTGQEKLVLGAEAPLWGELVTDEMLDDRLWPRAAALAERFWSAANVRDPLDMYRRLAVVQDQLTVSGLMADANRRRMASRLAPGDSEPVYELLQIVTPVRNMAHDHRIRAAARGQQIRQPLNALADAAPVESLVAQRFAADAQRFVSGDENLAASLRARLTRWRDNDERFAAVARGNAMLEPALPTAASIASLAQIGLDALDIIAGKRDRDASWTQTAETALMQAEAHDAASRLPLASFLGSQPPADLIIAITPGVRVLVGAVASGS